MQADRYHERIANDPLPRIVTTVTEDRIPYFSIPLFAELAYYLLLQTTEFREINIYAFAVMPDHIHVVAEKSGGKTVSDFMHSYKGFISREIGKWHDEFHAKAGFQPRMHTSVWQVSFNQLLIYGKEGLRNRINYVANNPVQHGIVKNRNEYRWTYVAPGYAHMVSR